MACGGAGVGRAAGRGGVGGDGCLLGAFLSGLFFRFVVGLSFPLYQFPGTIFDVGGRFQSVLDCLLGCSFLSHLVCFRPLLCVSLRSRVCVELLKTVHGITHPLSAPFYPSQSPRSSPRLSTRVAGRFLLLTVLRAVRFGRSCYLSGCGVSSSHRLSSRSFDTAGGERSVLAACGGVFVSAWCGIIPPRYRRWYSAACFAVGVLIVPSRSSCRIAWCGRLLEKWRRLVRPSSSWRCARHFASLGCLPNCPSFAYLVRFSYVSAFITAIEFAPPRVSNKAGRRTGRGFVSVFDLPLRWM